MKHPVKHIVYLTGFMGSGKSTIGPILANALGFSHVDIDHAIESRVGMTVTEFFAASGEPAFRSLEREVLQEVSRQNNFVVSLGGGTLTDPGNIRIVKSTGVLVYLRLSGDAAMKRLRHKIDRPMLRPPGGGPATEQDLRRRIDELMSARETTYQQADFSVTTNTRIGATVDEIVRRLRPLISP